MTLGVKDAIPNRAAGEATGISAVRGLFLADGRESRHIY